MPGSAVPLAGAGTFIQSTGHQLFGSFATVIGYPSGPVTVGCVRRVTLKTDDATLPPVNVTSDDVGEAFVPVAGQPATQAQWTIVAVSTRSQGGNRIHFVFPNAIKKATNPQVLIEDFRPSGQ